MTVKTPSSIKRLPCQILHVTPCSTERFSRRTGGGGEGSDAVSISTSGSPFTALAIRWGAKPGIFEALSETPSLAPRFGASSESKIALRSLSVRGRVRKRLKLCYQILGNRPWDPDCDRRDVINPLSVWLLYPKS